MKPVIYGVLVATILLTTFAGLSQSFQSIPEFVFKNAVLISGQPNQDGAVYKFSNIAPGYDATVTILGRSSTSVVMDTIDLTTLGWDKALQPQVGLKGNVPSNSNWWMKFQLSFLQSGKNKSANIGKFQATALDVDGDALSIQENLTMFKATSAKYSTPTSITQAPLGTAICDKDNKAGIAKLCGTCAGLGYTLDGGGNQKICKDCNGVGYVFSTCGHPWLGSDISIVGLVKNATDIDTNSVANMATFTYNNVSSFTFQYGAQSGTAISNGGMRLNSMWFKGFSLVAPVVTLPISLENFTARFSDNNVMLNWSTSTEINFSHFVIERSIDGKNFSDIALVFGNGSLNENASYSYKDAHIASSTGVVFYRLKSIDNSLAFTYSETKVIRLIKEQSAITLTAYPNPVTDQVRLTLPANWQGKPVSIDLYGGNGSRLQTIQVTNASQTETIKIGNMARGIYLVKVSCQNENAEQRLVKN